ncbi:MAG: hypothetical protein Ta2D_09140 [Rickettsiales bacterium]|nr:MAG: hypothetical protein Ta2D_09140 [Rickettsiales bacterium]
MSYADNYVVGDGTISNLEGKPQALINNEEKVEIVERQLRKYENNIVLDADRIEKLEEFERMGLVDKKTFKNYLEHKKKFEEISEISKDKIESLQKQAEEMLKIDVVLKKNRWRYYEYYKNKDYRLMQLLDTEYKQIIEYAFSKYGEKEFKNKTIEEKYKNKTIEEKRGILFTYNNSEMNSITERYRIFTDIKLESSAFGHIDKKVIGFDAEYIINSFRDEYKKLYEERIKMHEAMNKIFTKLTSEIGGSSFYLSNNENFFNSEDVYINGKKPFNDDALFVFDEKKPNGYCFAKDGKIYSFELNKKVKMGYDSPEEQMTYDWFNNKKYMTFKNIKEIEYSQLPKALQNGNLENAVNARDKMSFYTKWEDSDSPYVGKYRHNMYGCRSKIKLLNAHLEAREGKNVVADQTTRNSQKVLSETNFPEVKEVLAEKGFIEKSIESQVSNSSEITKEIDRVKQKLENNPRFMEILNNKKAILQNAEKTFNIGRN